MVPFGPVFVLLAQVFCLGLVNGLEWSTTPQDHMHACAGSTVTFPWNFKVAENETVLSVNWIHDGAQPSVVVATMVRDHFMATDAFSGRVRRVEQSKGGLVVEDVNAEDSGNYTLEVQIARGPVFESLKSTVNFQVADSLMLKGGQLQASQDPVAWWDQSSLQWFIRLTCGPFTFMGEPAVDVSWTTPDGKTLPSTGYESGHFYLSLVTPVQGGEYTCTIPPASLPGLCYRKDGGHDSQVVLSDHVTVDERSARLSMLEANQKTLLEDSEKLRDRLRNLKEMHVQDMENVTLHCRAMMKDMESDIQRVENEHDSVQKTVNKLFNQAGLTVESVTTTEGPRSSAQRNLEGYCREGAHKILNDSWRSVSEGQNDLYCDKELVHGWYRFVLNGHNAVMPTECVPKKHCNTHAPMWLNLKNKDLPLPGQEVDGLACANWDSNCCNWESPITVRNCGDYLVYHLQPGNDCHLAYCIEPQD